MTESTRAQLEQWADKYNDPQYFREDPIAFPRHFVEQGARLQDVEVAAVFAAHLAWGRRDMIVRDLQRLMDEMQWRPYDYVMAADYRDDSTSIHRTIRWSEIAQICDRLRGIYAQRTSLEGLSTEQLRTEVFGQKPDAKAPNKKINMMRRWMIRRDARVDFGLWTESDPSTLIIPLDVHVYDEAWTLGLTNRKSKDLTTAMQITCEFRSIWPDDPCRGDFALFGYGIDGRTKTDF